MSTPKLCIVNAKQHVHAEPPMSTPKLCIVNAKQHVHAATQAAPVLPPKLPVIELIALDEGILEHVRLQAGLDLMSMMLALYKGHKGIASACMSHGLSSHP